jgi:calpain-7
VVLERTSRINNNNFLPFMSVDLREQFRLNLPYTDKYKIRYTEKLFVQLIFLCFRSGLLALSPKQMKLFSRWARPDEFCSAPVMVGENGADCWSIIRAKVPLHSK